MSDLSSIEDHISLIGDIGLYQILLTFFVFFAGFLNADIFWITITGYTPHHHCKIYELELFPYDVKNFTIPRSRDGDFESCFMFDRNYSSYSERELLDLYYGLESHKHTPLTLCADWNYDYAENGETLATQYNWVCDKKTMNWVVTYVSFLGMLLASIICGAAMDVLGRRKLWIFGVIIRCLGYGISSFCIHQYAYLFGRFLSCFALTMVYTSGYVIVLEICAKKYRNTISIFISFGFSVGLFSFPWFAFYVPGWQHSYFFMMGISFLMLLTCPIVYESPRWLLLQGNIDEYSAVMHQIARINRKQLSDEFTFSDVQIETAESNYTCIKKLFETKSMILYSFIQFFTWFSTSLIFYSITMNLQDHFGDMFKTMCYCALSDVPTYFLRKLMLDYRKLGRKYSLLVILCTCGICNIAIIPFIIAEIHGSVITYLSLTVRAVAYMAFMSINLFTFELYSTEIRGIGILSCNCIGIIAAMVVPVFGDILPNIWKPLPYLIFAILSISSGILMILLPETKGTFLKQFTSSNDSPKSDLDENENSADETEHNENENSPEETEHKSLVE